jgi:hypothetical protein
MELETLKSVFLFPRVQHAAMKSKAELRLLLERKITTHLTLLKRNLLIELIIAALFFLFPVYIMFDYSGVYVQLFSVLLLIIMLTFIICAGRLYFLLRRHEMYSYSLKETVKQLVSIFKSYVNIYFLTTIILIPVFFAVALFMMYMENSTRDDLLYYINWKKSLLIYAGCFGVWMICMYYFTKWYLHQLYGKHVIQLKKTLAELEEQ